MAKDDPRPQADLRYLSSRIAQMSELEPSVKASFRTIESTLPPVRTMRISAPNRLLTSSSCRCRTITTCYSWKTQKLALEPIM